jgi:BolA protein
MTGAQWLEDRLRAELDPTYLEITDESAQHAGDRQETHFRVVVVSDRFKGQMPITRHRMVQNPLKPAFETGLHALALHTYTPAEWADRRGAPSSPPCRGGG